jgi:hypothetical protein
MYALRFMIYVALVGVSVPAVWAVADGEFGRAGVFAGLTVALATGYRMVERRDAD